jgi:hypothetical protein
MKPLPDPLACNLKVPLGGRLGRVQVQDSLPILVPRTADRAPLRYECTTTACHGPPLSMVGNTDAGAKLCHGPQADALQRAAKSQRCGALLP